MLFLLLSKIFSLAKTNFLTISINQNLECYPDFSIAFHIHKWLHSCFMHCSFVNRCKMFSPHYRLPISMANAKKKRKKNYNKTICCWLNSFCCILFLIASHVAHISKAFLTCNSDEAGVFSLDFFTRFFFAFLRSPEADCQLPSGGSPFPQNPILYAGISLPFPAKMIEFDALAASIACKFCYYSHCFCSLQLKCHFRSTLRWRQINMLIL